MPSVPRSELLRRLQRQHRACTLCVDAGHLDAAAPVFSGRWGQRILLVGQAPGPVEGDSHRPFSGRAGAVLVRWMLRAGFRSEDDFRSRVYMTSMTTCFPGRRQGASGDRRPSAAEVSLCSRWLDGVLELLEPRLVITVGSLALSRFLPGRRLDDAVGGEVDGGGGQVVVPLPHPSGQSRWLNDPARARLLGEALGTLGRRLTLEGSIGDAQER